MKKILYLFCMMCTLLTTGCHTRLSEKVKPPCIPTPYCFEAAPKTNCPIVKEAWWENFQDPQLNKLVNLAIKNNTDYQIAIKNVEIACTYIFQNRSNLFPQVNGTFSATYNKLSEASPNTNILSILTPFPLYQLGAMVSYEVDLWSQVKNSVRQAQADTCASRANSQIVKLTLISNVINTYFQMVSINSNLINLKAQLQAAHEIVSLVNAQFLAGLIDGQSLDNAKNQVEALKGNIDSLIKQQKLLKYTLAYLIGVYPECFNFNIPHVLIFRDIETYIPPAIPSCVIANRPDIQQAYYQILSAGYVVKQSIANFLPNINLTGNYGDISRNLNNLLSSTSQYWNYGIFISQFIFDYQYRASQYQRSKYQYESTILNYRGILLNAFKEVNSALISYQEDNSILVSYQKQAVNFQDIAKITQAQYQGGLVDYSIYLTAYLNEQQNAVNVTNQQLAIIQDVVQVYKTLGLGFHTECKK